MLTKTVELRPGLRITVRTATGRDVLNRAFIYRKLGLTATTDEQAMHYAVTFAPLFQQTTQIDGDLGFTWPSLASSDDEMQTALSGFLELPAPVVERWLGAIESVDTAPGDPALQPPDSASPKKD